MKKKILIVEDEDTIRESLREFFDLRGFDVRAASTGLEGLAMGRREHPDLLLLDIMLPGMHGYDVCRALREGGYGGPVVFVTAKGEEIDKLTGFDVGADDYVTKPFSLLELHARVKALLRRAEKDSPTAESFRFGDVEVNFTTYDTTVAGKPVRLSAREMDLLRYLITHAGQVLSRDELLENVWNRESDSSTRTVDTHILNLRRKLADKPPRRRIQTVHGVGYKFQADP